MVFVVFDSFPLVLCVVSYRPWPSLESVFLWCVSVVNNLPVVEPKTDFEIYHIQTVNGPPFSNVDFRSASGTWVDQAVGSPKPGFGPTRRGWELRPAGELVSNSGTRLWGPIFGPNLISTPHGTGTPPTLIVRHSVSWWAGGPSSDRRWLPCLREFRDKSGLPLTGSAGAWM